MASIHLPSFFNNDRNTSNHSKKDTNSILSRRSTISLKTQQKDDIPSLNKSTTTLSKVKRFGSLLSRNKKNDNSSISTSKRKIDTIFPSNIDTTLSNSIYSISTYSTNTTISSDEDDIITPTSTCPPPDKSLFSDENQMFNVIIPNVKQNCDPTEALSVTHQDQTNHILAEENVMAPIEESIVDNKQNIDPMALSSLVQFYLSTAIDEADIEIECELQLYRAQMLRSIQATPNYSF